MRSATRNKVGKDPAYLRWIRSLLCVVCFRSSWMEMIQRGEVWRMGREYNCYTRHDHGTEAAHVGDRGLSQKCPDLETLPLCRWHHTEGPESHHRLGKRFWQVWGLDRDALVKELQARYSRERAA